jgi:hypothetical protein
MEGPEVRSSALVATALSGATHLAFDALASRLPWTTPPYLLLDHASEGFRDLLQLDRTTILVAVACISAAVSGIISALLAAATEGVSRRVLVLGSVLSGLWMFSGALMILVYLDVPWTVAMGSLLAGAPRGFAIAWLLERVGYGRAAAPAP